MLNASADGPRLHSWIAVLLMVTIVSMPVWARDVADLYAARVEVADRSPAELARGTRAALGKVLVKLTGNRRAAGENRAATVLSDASKLLYKYGYEQDADGDGLLLAAEFDAPALQSQLTNRAIAVWGKERPETLLWLVVDEAGQRVVASGDEPGRWGRAALLGAERRGVPVLLPLVDIEEARIAASAATWPELYEAAVARAAVYGTPAALVGYIRESVPGIWEADWHLVVGAESLSWRQETDLPEFLVDDGVDTLADALARRFADPTVLAAAAELKLTVLGLENARDYALTMNYLQALDTVESLFVRGADSQRLKLDVRTRGGRAALEQSIDFGRVLVPLKGEADTYRLQR